MTSALVRSAVRSLVRSAVRGPSGPPLSIAMTSLPDATAGVAYSGQATASGGVQPYSYAKTAGPSWMSVDANTGAITGTPNADGTAITVTVTVTDAALADEPVTDTMDVAWTPYLLFLSAEKGGWYDPSVLSSVWEDSAGTTPASVDGVVGRINDLSGNGLHLTQTTTAQKPILRLASGKYYLDFATDDSLTNAAFDISAVSAVSLMVGIRKDADTTGIVVEHSADANTNAGSWHLSTADGAAPASYLTLLRGGTGPANVTRRMTTYTAPIINTVWAKYDISLSGVANEIAAFVNNAAPTFANAGTDSGTGNFTNRPIFVGRRNSASVPLDGRIYFLLFVGADKTASRASIETYCNARTGAY